MPSSAHSLPSGHRILPQTREVSTHVPRKHDCPIPHVVPPQSSGSESRMHSPSTQISRPSHTTPSQGSLVTSSQSPCSWSVHCWPTKHTTVPQTRLSRTHCPARQTSSRPSHSTPSQGSPTTSSQMPCCSSVHSWPTKQTTVPHTRLSSTHWPLRQISSAPPHSTPSQASFVTSWQSPCSSSAHSWPTKQTTVPQTRLSSTHWPARQTSSTPLHSTPSQASFVMS